MVIVELIDEQRAVHLVDDLRQPLEGTDGKEEGSLAKDGHNQYGLL